MMNTKKMPLYSEIVKKWHKDKEDMRSSVSENPIRRITDDKAYTIFANKGKQITDNNPYVNLVSVEEFDLIIENEPYPVAPVTMSREGAKSSDKALSPFLLMHKEVTGDPMYYIRDMGISKEKCKKDFMDPPPFNSQKKLNQVEMKYEIKKIANKLGFASVGVTKVDRRFISQGVDYQFPFDTIILLGYEMPMEIISRYPTPDKELGAFGAYAGCANNVQKIADMIRENGYDCRALMTTGEIKYPQLAVNAGLGNYSTYGVCVTPEVGTRLKYTAVLIDAELPLDNPRDFNIEEFCSRCRMCQKSCPSGAIPKEEIMHKGAIKRQTRYMNCFELMTYDKECLKCVRVCPFSMLGYETCMESLPAYYRYNLDDEINVRGGNDD